MALIKRVVGYNKEGQVSGTRPPQFIVSELMENVMTWMKSSFVSFTMTHLGEFGKRRAGALPVKAK